MILRGRRVIREDGIIEIKKEEGQGISDWRWRSIYNQTGRSVMDTLFPSGGPHGYFHCSFPQVSSAFLFHLTDRLPLMTPGYPMLLQNAGLHALCLCLPSPPSRLSSAWAFSFSAAIIRHRANFSLLQFRTSGREHLIGFSQIRCWLLLHPSVTKVRVVSQDSWSCLANSSLFSRVVGGKSK